MSSAATRMPRATISARAAAGIEAQIASGSRQRRLDEHRAAVDQARQRVALAERRHVVERHELDVVELGVLADGLVGDGQVVGRRQALLLRAVARVRLDVQAEQLADRVATSLLVVTDPKPPIEWPRTL